MANYYSCYYIRVDAHCVNAVNSIVVLSLAIWELVLYVRHQKYPFFKDTNVCYASQILNMLLALSIIHFAQIAVTVISLLLSCSGTLHLVASCYVTTLTISFLFLSSRFSVVCMNEVYGLFFAQLLNCSSVGVICGLAQLPSICILIVMSAFVRSCSLEKEGLYGELISYLAVCWFITGISFAICVVLFLVRLLLFSIFSVLASVKLPYNVAHYLDSNKKRSYDDQGETTVI